jgi:hypothetical protein
MRVGVVLKKIKNFNFFEKAQKWSKLSENDIYIYIYLRLPPKYEYGGNIFSQKKLPIILMGAYHCTPCQVLLCSRTLAVNS